jgi:hypothetical protein
MHHEMKRDEQQSRQGNPELLESFVVIVAGASYALLFGILVWQALRGQPLVHPDAISIAGYSAWAVMTLAAIAVADRHESRQSSDIRVWL